ncbi:MAG: hypothetical protein HPY44_14080 [Armatimonadetes bacterium]|nr:hypothetical protein [Armatimonadota bacterium]
MIPRLTTVAALVLVTCNCIAGQTQLRVENPAGVALAAWPITTGVPFPPGSLMSPENVRLLSETGEEIPLQVALTGAHPDGSVRWLLLDFQADLPPEGRVCVLEWGEGVTRRPIPEPLRVAGENRSVHIATGSLEFLVSGDRFNLFETLSLDGRPLISPTDLAGPYFVDDQGREYRASLDEAPEVGVESYGPLRTVVTARGWYCAPSGERKCRYIVRIHAFAGKPWVRVFYTWLMTENSDALRFRDIGLRIPIQTSQCAFSLDTGEKIAAPVSADSTPYLVQHDFDRFTARPAANATGQPLGTLSVSGPDGSCTLAVRDFRQLFPKELSANPEGITFHMWPAHGVPNPDRKVEDSMLQYLWFCHEGDVLDFAVPASYTEHVGEHSEYEYRYLRSAKYANAMGLAKTHELMLWFGEPGGSADASTTRGFQDAPAAMADPRWMCDSGVFGAMQPYSPEQFPEYEQLIEGNFDAEQRMQEHTRDYGMWNFGDAHTNWDMARNRWADVYRVWRNTHHGAPRTPWLLYFRSGDPKYLQFAVRNARHVLDEDFCHWSTPETEALPYPKGKIKGALNDYKGIVHWHSGNRLTDYNSMTDFALWYTHMTGDRWGLEVATDWGEAVKKRFVKPFGHREGAGTLSALIELYKDTRDEGYRPIIESLAKYLMSTQNRDPEKGVVGSFPQWENYAPWLERYWELTRSEEARQAILAWAKAYGEGYGDSSSDRSCGEYINILAYAYIAGQDLDSLAQGVWEAQRAVGSIYRGPDPLLQGLMQNGQTSLAGFHIQRLPALMKALAMHGKPVKPKALLAAREDFPLLFARTRPVIDGVPTKIETVECWLLEDTDRPFTVTFSTSHTYPERQFTIIGTGPSGAEVFRSVETYPAGAKELVATVPADGETGIYRFTVAAPGSFGKVGCPIRTDPAMPVAFPLAGRLAPMLGARYFAYVPAGVSRLGLTVTPAGEGAVTARLSSPEEDLSSEVTSGSERKPYTTDLLDVGSHTGVTWQLDFNGVTSTIEFVSQGADIPLILFQEAYPAEICERFTEAL